MCDIYVNLFHIYPPRNDIKIPSLDQKTLKVELEGDYMAFFPI